MPIYPGRREKTWRITVYANGKQHEEIVEGNKRDATKREAKLRLELLSKPASEARAELLFKDFIADYYAPDASLHIGKNTWNRCRKYQLANLTAMFGELKLSKVSDLAISFKKRELARGCKPASVNHDLMALKTALNWAVKKGLLETAPHIDYLPTSGKRRVYCWSTEEVRRLYKAAAELSSWMLPILHFMLDTGVRKGELMAAEWSWVDHSAKM